MVIRLARNSGWDADRLPQLRLELACRIAAHVGSREKVVTPIPGLTLHRRTGPSPPCSMIYEPSLILVAQGRKRVELGGRAFTYGSSHYLLSSVALPVVARVVQASEQRPCLAVSWKLPMPVVREVLSREEMAAAAPGDPGLGLAVSEVTVELLECFCRLMRLLDRPQDTAFLQGLIEREIIYWVLRGPLGARLRGIANSGAQSYRTAKAVAWIKENYARSLLKKQVP